MAYEADVLGAIGPKTSRSWIDREIAALAARQYGVVAGGQLSAIGLSREAIRYRVERGRLHLLYRHVYAVGHRRLTVEGRWMAAVLAAGEGTVLSHRSAGAHWGILQTARAAIEVTVPRQRRPRSGIELHVGRLPADEVTVHEGIPITTVPRTIFDLAAVERPSRVEGAFNQAEVQRLTDTLSLSDLLQRYPRARGTRTIRAILASEQGGITRKELEHRFREFIDNYRLPRPKFNHHVRVVQAPDRGGLRLARGKADRGARRARHARHCHGVRGR